MTAIVINTILSTFGQINRNLYLSKHIFFQIFCSFLIGLLINGQKHFRDINWLSELYKGDERPVKIMRLDYSSDSQDNQALAKLKLLQDD